MTTAELLKGRSGEAPASPATEAPPDAAPAHGETSAGPKPARFRNGLAVAVSAAGLLGILVCAVCDAALSGALTWSWYPLSAIVFAWLVCMPLIKSGSRGIGRSLGALSAALIPFLWVLSRCAGEPRVLTVGAGISVVSLGYLWCVYGLFARFRGRWRRAAGISLLLALPLCAAVNGIVASALGVPLLDGWDALAFAVLLAAGIGLLSAGRDLPGKKE